MADPVQLEILRQGFAAWNAWRAQYREARVDLSEADLSEAELTRADLRGADLSGADLTRADLSRAHLIGANFSKARLSAAKLTLANFSKARLSAANLSRAKLTLTNLSGANLSGANFTEADLFRANLTLANLSEANLSEANLSEANLSEANLSEADLTRADLSEANLSEADLSEADLSRADLSRANLSEADLREANLSYAVLARADLIGAGLSGADLTRADLSGAYLLGADLGEANLSGVQVGQTVFGNVDLSQVVGLETVNHWAPSTIGIDTIYRSGGKIPEVFLRRAGVPDSFITYMHSLVYKPIEFYSCFISYSSRDQDFAERLYADLQTRNVRCWFAPEDLKIGDRFRERIEESIRVYDKLLLVLSEHSVASPWVEREVVAALSREDQHRQTVLFPIKLDETVRDSETYWAAEIQRSRHIGDFTRWKDHDAYQKSLTRLLRALTAADKRANPG